ncbi:MAG: polyhydroxyalkanoate synthesis regulator DNA-binding domain-containing protein [Proteobacteria bacterium]|nr:polyhydroxyalkanoate synthesis regulator DNA-binding domain-containing protein [Pseudomonadota bacterium]
MAILIKRYANRKLYNTQASRYITLKGIGELIDGGQEVRVIDNETGEDITSVTLSQILVDSERSKSGVPQNLLTELLQKGGDVLYGALRRGVGDASQNLEDLQSRVRRMIQTDQEGEETDDAARSGLSDWIALASPDLDHMVQNAVERVFKLLDLPRRSDVDALSQNLQRVADALERLERAPASRDTDDPPSP